MIDGALTREQPHPPRPTRSVGALLQQYRVSHHELMRQTANGMAVAPAPDMGWTFTIISGAILWLLCDATLRRLNQ